MDLKEHLRSLRNKALELRITLLEMLSRGDFGYSGSCLSAMDLLVGLYYGLHNEGSIMQFDPAVPGSPSQDYFVLSKAQAAPALYTILADLGFINPEELNFFAQTGSLLQAHPHLKIPGIALPSGMPGNGLGSAVGLAISLKAERARNMVYVLIGDAELCNGPVWESIMLAGHHKLDNLVVIVDKNTVQIDGLVRNNMMMDPIPEKFESFGWKVIQVRAGHDFNEILGAYDKALSTPRFPIAIIAKTMKGKGVDFAEGKSFYHSNPLSQEELEEALNLMRKQLHSHQQ